MYGQDRHRPGLSGGIIDLDAPPGGRPEDGSRACRCRSPRILDRPRHELIAAVRSRPAADSGRRHCRRDWFTDQETGIDIYFGIGGAPEACGGRPWCIARMQGRLHPEKGGGDGAAAMGVTDIRRKWP
jgi:fructose-1,6-bisphosphatase/sedoheptulose 1,7-bisphosphatase-like protein